MNAEKQIITGRELLNKFCTVWNATHGSEWNRKAGGFVKASIWDKKEGELRVYFGKTNTPLVLKERSDGRVYPSAKPTKYGLDELAVPLIQQIASDYSVHKLDRVLMQEDEDGIIAPAGQHEQGVHIVREWYA